MPKPVKIYILSFGILLAGTFLGVAFVANSQLHLKSQAPSTTVAPENILNLSDNMTMSVDLLNELDWQNLDDMLRIVGKDSEKRDQVIQISMLT